MKCCNCERDWNYSKSWSYNDKNEQACYFCHLTGVGERDKEFENELKGDDCFYMQTFIENAQEAIKEEPDWYDDKWKADWLN